MEAANSQRPVFFQPQSREANANRQEMTMTMNNKKGNTNTKGKVLKSVQEWWNLIDEFQIASILYLPTDDGQSVIELGTPWKLQLRCKSSIDTVVDCLKSGRAAEAAKYFELLSDADGVLTPDDINVLTKSESIDGTLNSTQTYSTELLDAENEALRLKEKEKYTQEKLKLEQEINCLKDKLEYVMDKLKMID